MQTFKFSLALLVSVLFAGGLRAANAEASAFFASADAFFMRYADGGSVDYAALKRSGDHEALVAQIAATPLGSLRGDERTAFLINAYNVLVIEQAVAHYPLRSVLDVPDFFDAAKHDVGGERVTLNDLEKELLLKVTGDARLHFALVCGAVGCPPIISEAYAPTRLQAQLDRQARLALNDARFIRVSGERVELSQIFEWYASDFGGSKAAVVAYVNGFRQNPLPAGAKVGYYRYDWSLNGGSARAGAVPEASGASPAAPGGAAAANSARYVVSSTIPAGTFEIKNFNNLYSQDAAGERSTFFTTTTSVLYGLTDRINVGAEGRYRRVRYDASDDPAGNFSVFRRRGAEGFREGLTGVGPKVRIAPFAALENFSVQSTYLFATSDDGTGALREQRFLDFDGDTWITQFFNDFSVGSRFSVFTEVDLTLEDIGASDEGHINRFSTPVTGIVSFFPEPNTTLYVLGNYSPYFQEDFDFFYQVGAGAKYQITPRFEVELLATSFRNAFILEAGGTANTVNLGIRVNL